MPKHRKNSTKPQSPQRDRSRRRTARDYRLSVRGELRKQPDVSKIARVVVAMALAQAEAEAQAQAHTEATDGQVQLESSDAAGHRTEDGASDD